MIYEPSGRAREYSQLAINLYRGCTHSCKYCYAPGITFTRRTEFHNKCEPKENVLDRLEADCKKMKGDPRDILLCFTCDPYQPGENGITRKALKILAQYNMQVQILTKGGQRAIRDFDILQNRGWKFGTTLSFKDEAYRTQWEPHASDIIDRIKAIDAAHQLGIYTWVSVEPVISPPQAIEIITSLRNLGIVDHFKVSKINYHKYIENKIDWGKFLKIVEHILKDHSYYIKKDLLKAAGRI